MKLTKDDVEHIAHLARLEVDDQLVDKFAGQISRIMDYIGTLKDADVSGVALASETAFQTNVFREDEVQPSPGPQVTLANAPERDDDYYTVPKIVG